MGQVLLDMAMSLDGFVGGPKGEDKGLNDWYFAPSPQDQMVIDELIADLGAIIMGRNAYQTGEDYGGYENDPYNAAYFVLTNRLPEPDAVPKGFTFVSDGIESALRQAKVAAGNRQVCVAGGANMAQQYLKAGLVDEIQLHLIPMLLGEGLRLFENATRELARLEITRVVNSPAVTHIKYRVIR